MSSAAYDATLLAELPNTSKICHTDSQVFPLSESNNAQSSDRQWAVDTVEAMNTRGRRFALTKNPTREMSVFLQGSCFR